eukprot:TRINITY_DN25391_c0_g1_i1.p2 TRINITY_DN25391_c0_g1~~TRINITY_DN25391_c0_g1_i1.p2  ORF type:complete len:305 (+),score=110.32 TRINITY_DN25391_c0_g1_i1:476-1390(+)
MLAVCHDIARALGGPASRGAGVGRQQHCAVEAGLLALLVPGIPPTVASAAAHKVWCGDAPASQAGRSSLALCCSIAEAACCWVETPSPCELLCLLHTLRVAAGDMLVAADTVRRLTSAGPRPLLMGVSFAAAPVPELQRVEPPEEQRQSAAELLRRFRLPPRSSLGPAAVVVAAVAVAAAAAPRGSSGPPLRRSPAGLSAVSPRLLLRLRPVSRVAPPRMVQHCSQPLPAALGTDRFWLCARPQPATPPSAAAPARRKRLSAPGSPRQPFRHLALLHAHRAKGRRKKAALTPRPGSRPRPDALW